MTLHEGNKEGEPRKSGFNQEKLIFSIQQELR